MPVKSKMQRRAMYAAAAGKSKLGIPAAVGKEFIAASHGMTKMPKRVKHKIGKRKMAKPQGMRGMVMP